MAEEVLDLEFEGLKLFQETSGYCFTSDSVLLANYIKCKKKDIAVEFCAGSGVISILLSKKQNPKKIYAFELQKRLYEMFCRSVKLNNLEDVIMPINARLEDFSSHLEHGAADVVFCNPPYNKAGDRSESAEIAIATHEVETNLESIIKNASKLLKFGGNFYMIHKTERLVDVLHLLREYKIEPKRLTIIYPKLENEPVVFLVRATRGAAAGLRVDKVHFANDFKFSKNEF